MDTIMVTIHANELAADARRWAGKAASLTLTARQDAAEARAAAQHLPADFRTPGGATAFDVVAMAETDLAAVIAAAARADAAATRAERAEDYATADEAELAARHAYRAARFDAETVARMRRYLS